MLLICHSYQVFSSIARCAWPILQKALRGLPYQIKISIDFRLHEASKTFSQIVGFLDDLTEALDDGQGTLQNIY